MVTGQSWNRTHVLNIVEVRDTLFTHVPRSQMPAKTAGMIEFAGIKNITGNSLNNFGKALPTTLRPLLPKMLIKHHADIAN